MKRGHLLFLLLIICGQVSLAQKEHNIWHFGYGAGLNFNSGAPVSISGGKTGGLEGTASICDTSGKLLFYSDGVSVWDSTHTLMPNGTGLLGGTSSTQSAIILKQPGSSDLYYLFTAPQINTTNPVTYSIVDMTLNGGKGDISSKNNALVSPATEKLTYCKHANDSDYWIICHQWLSNSFFTYSLSASGLNTTPVISSTGIIASGPEGNKIGYLKASPCGDKLASATFYLDSLELFDFNNSTGIVSNGFTLSGFQSPSGVYGVEFSPKQNFLYCSFYFPGTIYQFDLKAGSPAAIAASRTIVGTNLRSGSLQNGPDGKIYVAVNSSTYPYLDRINYPDSAGVACNYEDSAVSIAPNLCGLGLPNYVAVEFCSPLAAPEAHFISSDSSFCNEAGACIDFFDSSLGNPTGWQWFFPGAIPDTSTVQNPTGICYYLPGTYPVTLIVNNPGGNDTLTVSPMITFHSAASAPILIFSGDTILSSHASAYQWYFNGSLISGATDSFYVVTGDGIYAVQIIDGNGCSLLSSGFPVSAKELSRTGGILVYPNPAKDQFTVSGFEFTVGASIEIYDAIGKKVLSTNLNNKQQTIECKHIPPGIYLIEVKSNQKIYRTKFIKD